MKIASNVIPSTKSSTGYVLISTADTFDAGPETMVFACTSTGEVTDWGDLDVDHYDDADEAVDGHKAMVARWKA